MSLEMPHESDKKATPAERRKIRQISFHHPDEHRTARLSDFERRLLVMVSTQSKAMTVKEIAQAMALPKTNAHARVLRLYEDGYLQRKSVFKGMRESFLYSCDSSKWGK